MSTDDLRYASNHKDPVNPYPEPWRDHRFLVFLKVGLDQKTSEVDFLRNTTAVERLCESDRKDAARLLRILANDMESGLGTEAGERP